MSGQRFGLSAAVVGRIQGVLARHPIVEKAVIYGSRAKGNYRPGSDIDLSLFAAEGQEISHRELASILDEIDDLLLPYTIDLSAFEQLHHDRLREHIERVGQVFYQRGGAGEHPSAGMKSGWDKRKLGDMAEVIAGQSPEGSFYNSTGDGLPFYQGKKEFGERFIGVPTTWTSRITKVAFEGDVLMSVRAPVGPVNFATEKACIGRGLAAIRSGKDLDKNFLFYFLVSKQEEICGNEGAVFASINKNDIQGIEIAAPPLDEQQRIVAILDEAFDGIATAKANAEKNLQNARDIFRASLNGAVIGELTREWRSSHPDMEIASEQLKRALAKRRNQRKGASGCVDPRNPVFNKPIDIPSSWTLASPEQLAISIIDCPHTTPKWTTTGVACLRTTNFKPGFLDLGSVQFVSEKTYSERIMRLEPKPGDVLYSREGGILGIACIFPDGLKACLGQRMMQFRLDEAIAEPLYFTAVLNSQLILSEVKRLTGGAASPHLNIRDIRTFPIPLPPIAEQHEIIANLNALLEETFRLEFLYQRKLTALDDLKKSLLHRAFSGQL